MRSLKKERIYASVVNALASSKIARRLNLPVEHHNLDLGHLIYGFFFHTSFHHKLLTTSICQHCILF